MTFSGFSTLDTHLFTLDFTTRDRRSIIDVLPPPTMCKDDDDDDDTCCWHVGAMVVVESLGLERLAIGATNAVQ